MVSPGCRRLASIDEEECADEECLICAVRANQKDAYYLSQLTEQFEDVARSLLGQFAIGFKFDRLTHEHNIQVLVGCRIGVKNWRRVVGSLILD